jgi:hypothetical protein
MQKRCLPLVVLFVSSCALSANPQGVKTPEEIVAEQEALGEEQLAEENETGSLMEAEETESEERAKFDKAQAKLELQRAARSAATCPDSLPEDQKKAAKRGIAEVEIWFDPSGTVRKAELAPPHAETPEGACIMRAMKAVIVPAFVGEVVQVKWKIDLSEQQSE